VTILVTAVLSLLLGLAATTNTMTDVSKVSAITVLLPLVTGAAGALNLTQAENDNLVAGTAVGLLVAASLAPPAGLVGMVLALGRWNMVVTAVLLLGLLTWQFAGSGLNLERSSLEQRTINEVETVLSENRLASLIEANLRFTRPPAEQNRQPTLLGVIYVQPEPNVTTSTEEIKQELTRAIQQQLATEYNVTPLISVVVLESLEQK
jgi:uncharacterized membrane protein